MATADLAVPKDQPDIMCDIEKLQSEIDTSQDSCTLFETDEFRIYCYKVLPCSKRAAHEWTTCPWAHPGEKARRRDPRIYNYLAIPCQETKEGKECPRGDDCPNCHSLFEYWLHPSRYRTQLCRNNDGCHCKRQICFFAHSIEELRVPDHSHLKIPDEIKQASAVKDATISTVEPAGSPKPAPSSPAAAAASSDETAAAKAPVPQLRKDRRHSKGSISRAAAASLPPAPSAMLASSAGVSMLESSARLATPAPGAALCGFNNSSALASLLSCPQAQGGTGVPYDSKLAAQWVQQQQQLGALHNSCYASPATPAAALRRAASLDVATGAPGRLSFETPVVTAGRFSLDTARPGGPNSTTASWANSSLFSNSMAADPEVPDPSNSPQSARRAFLLQQQQMQLFQSQHLEQQLDAAAVEQQLQIIMAQQQQQQMKQKAAWVQSVTTTAPGSRRGSYVDYAVAGGGGSRRGSYVDHTAAGGGSRRGSYVDYGFGGSRRGSYVDYGVNAASRRGSYVDYVSGTGSPPLSPATSSMLGSGSSGVPEECQSVSSHASPYLGLPTSMWPVPALHRTISGPAAYSNMAAIPGTAIRYNSLDPATLAAATAASQVPVSAADVAAAAAATRVQMEFLNGTPQSIPSAAVSAGLPAGCGAEQFKAAAQVYQEQPVAGDNLNLQNVAELVDSVNRGELGERGSVVLTGVIGLLMQQLQQQQLAAVQEV